jgi:flagellar L-ring protein FlgH
MKLIAALLMVVVAMAPATAAAAAKQKIRNGVVQNESLDQYLVRMQQRPGAAEVKSLGSLWSDNGRLASIASDFKAMHVGDLITIVVAQDITANNSGSVSSARNFSASSGISGLAGQIKTTNLTTLFSPTSASSLTGKGQAATASSLRTSLAGRVVAVLPSGAMVIEAERQLTMNNERQTILLRGMVRSSDIGSNNTVASNAIANLELELKGKGVISEGDRPPNVIVRAILRIVGF